MLKHKSTKIVRSYEQYHSLTHFLAIPLLSPVSRPEFRNSITRLLEDPSAATVPRQLIRPLDTLHIRLAAMSLKTPELFAKSTEVLQGLNFANILEGAPKDSEEGVALDAERLASSLTMTPASSAPRKDVAPLNVSIRGLHSDGIGMEAQSTCLRTNVVDLTQRLNPLLEAIRYAYVESGLLNPKHKSDAETDRFRTQDKASSIVSIVLMRSIHLQPRPIPSSHHQANIKKSPVRIYDFTDIINQYKDKTWSPDIRLDRVSICELGLTKKIRLQGGGIDSDLGLSEVFSVPLP